jgi:hypothetical protein
MISSVVKIPIAEWGTIGMMREVVLYGKITRRLRF